MERILEARITYFMWALMGLAVPFTGGLAIFGLIELAGVGKIFGAIVLCFCGFAIEAVIGFGTVRINSQALEATCLLGRYRIGWDEIESFWNDSSNLNWVFEGGGKRVSIPASSLWRSSDKGEMVEIMKRKLEERDIKPRLDGGVKTFLLSNRASKITE